MVRKVKHLVRSVASDTFNGVITFTTDSLRRVVYAWSSKLIADLNLKIKCLGLSVPELEREQT